MDGGVLLWDLATADLVVSGRRNASPFNKVLETFFLTKAPDSWLLQATSGPHPTSPRPRDREHLRPSACLPTPIPGPWVIRFSTSPTPFFGSLPQGQVF